MTTSGVALYLPVRPAPSDDILRVTHPVYSCVTSASIYSAMKAAQQHLRRRHVAATVKFWLFGTRRQAAGAELHAAAEALRRGWMTSAGLRALDRVARCARLWTSRPKASRLLLTSSTLNYFPTGVALPVQCCLGANAFPLKR